VLRSWGVHGVKPDRFQGFLLSRKYWASRQLNCFHLDSNVVINTRTVADAVRSETGWLPDRFFKPHGVNVIFEVLALM